MPRSDEESIRVLHVDDDSGFLDLSAKCLERNDDGIDVLTATTPDEGLDVLAAEDIDCVLADYDIPGPNGIEFLERVREERPRLPFILFTSSGSENIASDAISAGATDYIRKQSGTDQFGLVANRIRNAVLQFRAEKQVARAEQRLQELSEATNDILWMTSADWSEFLFVNSAYEDIWGLSRETLFEDPTDFMDGVHPDDRELAMEMMGRVSTGESVDFEMRVNAAEDFGRWVWIQAHPVYDAGESPDRIAGFVRDITERKARSQELERQNERLDQFASIVSHDLRSPLAVAQGQAELVADGRDDEDLERLQSSLARIETIVDDTLRLARAGGVIETAEECDLATLAEAAWANVETADGTLEVRLDDATVEADTSRLLQVFENLFRNAVDHNDEPPTVEVGLLEADSGFYVEDTGDGLPEGDAEVLFDHSYTTSDEGSGFGLAIVADIVDAHDWSVTATDGDDGGARFEIRTG